MDSASDSLPLWLQIVGLGLAAFSAGGVALAVPTFLQVFFGAPQFRSQYDAGSHGESGLIVYLDNRPSGKWLNEWSVIKRDTIQSLTVSFQIYHVESSNIVIPIRQARIYSDDDPTDLGSYRVELPPTYSVAASIVLVIWSPEIGQFVVPPGRTQAPLPLTPGLYEARLVFIVDGAPVKESRRFQVGTTETQLQWLAPSDESKS